MISTMITMHKDNKPRQACRWPATQPENLVGVTRGRLVPVLTHRSWVYFLPCLGS